MSREKVILVYIGKKLPRYAHASLEMSSQFSGLDIVLLGNSILKNQVKNSHIDFVCIEDFYDSTKFMEIVSKINSPLSFRNGFWAKTVERLFVLHQYMEVYEVQKIFHAELDQMLFRCDKLLESLENSKFTGIAFPFHAIDRGIASVLYCNDMKSLESLLNFAGKVEGFNNEMELLAQWAISRPDMVKLLPTIASEVKKSDVFHRSGLEILPSATIGGIVDALQIGQWIGGEDPRNVNIANWPKNKYVDHVKEGNLVFNELLNLNLKLSSDGSLLVSYEKSRIYNLYNVHLHAKIHPWIMKSNGNFMKLLDASNRPELFVFPTTRRIQLLYHIAVVFNSVRSHPIEFTKRRLSQIFKLFTRKHQNK